MPGRCCACSCRGTSREASSSAAGSRSWGGNGGSRGLSRRPCGSRYAPKTRASMSLRPGPTRRIPSCRAFWRNIASDRHPAETAGADSRTRGAEGPPVASVVSLDETHHAEGNGLSRLVDFGVATVAIPGATGRASCRARRRSIARTVERKGIRDCDWMCNESA